MENTIDAFDFNSLKDAVGIDPFAKQSNKFAKDERFYNLTKDKDGNGAALIRFLPDSEKRMIVQLQKIGTTVVKNGKKRFVSEFSPVSIGMACPFQETWQRLWNEGNKEEAKIFGKSLRYITNIKVLKDPGCPENEGKIFLYEMSGALNSKLEKALNPSAQDIALGKTPKQVFNPIKGNSFRLVAQKGANGQINYDSSEVVPEESSVYATVEEAINDIKMNTHTLSSLLKPEAFLSYDELKKKLDYVTWKDAPTTAPAVQAAPEVQAAPTVQAAPVAPAAPAVKNANDDLDAILNGLV